MRLIGVIEEEPKEIYIVDTTKKELIRIRIYDEKNIDIAKDTLEELWIRYKENKISAEGRELYMSAPLENFKEEDYYYNYSTTLYEIARNAYQIIKNTKILLEQQKKGKQ